MADAELRDLQMLPWIYPFLRMVQNVLRTLRCVRAERSAIEQRQAASVYPEARRIGCLEGQSRQLSVCFMYVCVHVAAWTHLPLYAATAVSAVQQSPAERRVHRLLVYVVTSVRF